MAHQNVQWRVKARLSRFDADIDAYRERYGKAEGEARFFAEHAAAETEEVDGNLLMTAGADLLIKGITAGGVSPLFNSANAYIGVGDSTAAEAVSQTDLQAATNKARVGMDSTYPSHSSGTNSVIFSSTFGSSSANYVWNEWAIFNASSGGTMLNRKVSALGTKTTGTWQLQVTITIS